KAKPIHTTSSWGPVLSWSCSNGPACGSCFQSESGGTWHPCPASKSCYTFLFLSRCFLTATAFLIRPLDLRILRILLPVTKRTWATPWESLRITPRQGNKQA
uniref:Uncharacterized protein n=1 Tax=Sander lucioperca TaxID=283035 RepID=A0A8D0D6U1_SANLU